MCGVFSAKKEGWKQHDGLEFLIDDELPESMIRLSKDSMILAKLNTSNGLGVAQVLEILEVTHPGSNPFAPLSLSYNSLQAVRCHFRLCSPPWSARACPLHLHLYSAGVACMHAYHSMFICI